MAELIACCGIPGSGKSYWAKEQADKDSNVIVVTRSDIREEYGYPSGYAGSLDKEKLVISEMKRRIIAGLKANKTVISADINIFDIDCFRLLEIAKNHHALFSIKWFDTPLAVCIERDSKRDDAHKVGAESITLYHKRYEEIRNDSRRVNR